MQTAFISLIQILTLPLCSDLEVCIALWLKTKIETAWLAFLPPFPNAVITPTALCSRHKALFFQVLTYFVSATSLHSDPLHVTFLPWGSISFSIFFLIPIWKAGWLSYLHIWQYRLKFPYGTSTFLTYEEWKLFLPLFSVLRHGTFGAISLKTHEVCLDSTNPTVLLSSILAVVKNGFIPVDCTFLRGGSSPICWILGHSV